jgi:hypothetical protein
VGIRLVLGLLLQGAKGSRWQGVILRGPGMTVQRRAPRLTYIVCMQVNLHGCSSNCQTLNQPWTTAISP